MVHRNCPLSWLSSLSQTSTYTRLIFIEPPSLFITQTAQTSSTSKQSLTLNTSTLSNKPRTNPHTNQIKRSSHLSLSLKEKMAVSGMPGPTLPPCNPQDLYKVKQYCAKEGLDGIAIYENERVIKRAVLDDGKYWWLNAVSMLRRG
jgi:hypothetical protein